jgi:hypothetical protein
LPLRAGTDPGQSVFGSGHFLTGYVKLTKDNVISKLGRIRGRTGFSLLGLNAAMRSQCCRRGFLPGRIPGNRCRQQAPLGGQARSAGPLENALELGMR